jgi:DNA-binding Lrp family transcriptional regulator
VAAQGKREKAPYASFRDGTKAPPVIQKIALESGLALATRAPRNDALPQRSVFAGLTITGGTAMTPFFVQIKCQLGKSYDVANRLAESEIASEIYSTAGDFDLLVKFYVDAGTDIGHFVNEKVQTIPGIQDTRTIITFKAFQS